MARAPELGDECRPGGSCPECNGSEPVCGYCGENPIEPGADRCGECIAALDEANEDPAADLLADRPSHETRVDPPNAETTAAAEAFLDAMAKVPEPDDDPGEDEKVKGV